MFAKLARLGHFGRTQNVRFAAWPANDNHWSRCAGALPRPRSIVLTCRWHRMPGGALECIWTVEDGDSGGVAASAA